jgi:ribose 5-phosphate isomerase RpiB
VVHPSLVDREGEVQMANPATLAAHLVTEFLAARFTGEEKHARRLTNVNKLDGMR